MAKLPDQVSQVRVRADEAFFDHRLMEYIEQRRAFYAIVARLARPLKNRSGLDRSIRSGRLHSRTGDLFLRQGKERTFGWILAAGEQHAAAYNGLGLISGGAAGSRRRARSLRAGRRARSGPGEELSGLE